MFEEKPLKNVACKPTLLYASIKPLLEEHSRFYVLYKLKELIELLHRELHNTRARWSRQQEGSGLTCSALAARQDRVLRVGLVI